MRSRRTNKFQGKRSAGRRSVREQQRNRRKKRALAQDIDHSFEQARSFSSDEATVMSLEHDSNESVYDAVTPVVPALIDSDEDTRSGIERSGIESHSEPVTNAGIYNTQAQENDSKGDMHELGAERTSRSLRGRSKQDRRYVSAGLFRRLLAGLIDALALAPVLYIATWIISLVDTQLSPRGGFTSLFDWAIEGSPMLILWFVLAVIFAVGYQFVFLSFLGATVGSWLLKMRVVAEDGGPLTSRVVLIRTCSLCLGLLAFGLGVAWIGVHPLRQGLHDIFCRTFVIRDDARA